MSNENLPPFKENITPVPVYNAEINAEIEMITKILAELENNPPATPASEVGRVAELNPGQPKHPVFNDPRPIDTPPEYKIDVSPDAAIPPRPQETL